MPKAGMELRGKWTFDAALDADARAYAKKAHLNPGRKRLAAETADWREFSLAVRRLLQPG